MIACFLVLPLLNFTAWGTTAGSGAATYRDFGERIVYDHPTPLQIRLLVEHQRGTSPRVRCVL